MQTATLNERGVTLLDRSLVFFPLGGLMLFLGRHSAFSSLHVATQKSGWLPLL